MRSTAVNLQKMLHNILRQNAVNCILKRRLTAVGPFSRNKSHMMYASWDMKCNRHNFLVILGHFLPFTLQTTLKIKIWKKYKKTPGHIILWQMCTINEDHMMYGSWDKRHDGQFLVILAHLLPFDPPNKPKNQIFEGKKIKYLEILSFYSCVSQMTII